MKTDKNIKFTFGLNDWLNANRRASRMIEIENGVFTPKTKIHKSKKVYNRKKRNNYEKVID